MIAEYFGQLAVDFVVFLSNLFGDYQIPPELTSARGTMLVLLESSVGLGVWVDWNVLGLVMAAVGLVYGIGLSIRLIRAVVAHVPQFGGAGG